MRDLAMKIGITDVGLKKLLKGYGIVTPPQGHWNRAHAGQKVPDPPAARPRGPGETGRIRLDARFRGLVAEAVPIPEEGPFASTAVPEDLEQLRAQEETAIGRVSVVRALDRPHAALAALVRRDQERREKQAASGWAWDGPRWAGPLAQRQLKILDALFPALSARGHESWTRVVSGELEIWCRIGAMQLELAFGHSGRKRERYGRDNPPRGDQPADTPLRLTLLRDFRSPVTSFWDDCNERLEKRLGAIAAELIVAGEAAFRQSLVEAREWDEQMARLALSEQMHRLVRR